MASEASKNFVPENDSVRLKALHAYSSFFSGDNPSLQNLVEMMADDLQVPIAAISFVEKEEVTISYRVGISKDLCLPRNSSFCSQTILSNELTVVEDPKNDPVLCHNPHVQRENGLLFYAGMPLITAEGFRIGAVCIADRKKRTLTQRDRRQLERYARCVMHDLEMKARLLKKSTQLQDWELQLLQAYKLARIGRWEYDILTKEASWSDELYEIYGVDKTTCSSNLLSVYLSLIHPEDKADVYRKLAKPELIPDLTRERLIRPDGKQIYINQYKQNITNDEGVLVKVVGISQDVTDQIEIQEQIKKNEERFKALVQNSSDVVVILDSNGIIQYISPSLHKLVGYEPEELIGQNVFEYLHPDDQEETMAELEEVTRAINTGEPTLHRFKRKNGGWTWLESKGTNMLHDSHIGGLVINARDVTERIQLEEQLAIEQQNHQREITSAVIRAQENERSELGRELHDNVNQVLTTIKLYTEMIYDDMEKGRELAQKSGVLLQHSIDEIRSISKRLSAPTLGEISLADSIKELVESINLTNRIEITCKVDEIAGMQIPQEVHIAVYRIIQEQLNNIIKYANASLVSITLDKPGQYLKLQITDNGKGFDTRAKRSGIGITNMQTRAENLGGLFRINSSPGAGCIITVRFPMQ